jgi:acyl-CoA reductase-like NAD-dependent aldehyde dehydrogenase
MSDARQSPLIDGQRIHGEGGEPACVNPYTREPFAAVSLASPAQVTRAIEVAHQRFEAVRRAPAWRRSEWLAATSRGIAVRREEIARTIALEVGKPIRTARAEVDRAVTTFRVAADEATRLGGETIPMDAVPNGVGFVGLSFRQPRGVVAAITPFNFPLNLLAHKVAPALASGNTVVAKPAPRAPLTALLLGEIALDAGVPPGAFNVVPATNEGAAPLVSHPLVRLVSFTGSVPVGRLLRERAGLKPIVLELGSNAPNIVAPSAKLDEAVPALVAGAFAYAGQVCISVQRIYVHCSIRDAFQARFVPAVESLRLGDPLDEATDVGPMLSDAEVARALGWIDEARGAGARILTGGRRDGPFLLPTVIADPPDGLRCVEEEVFAPVVNVSSYEDFADAVRRANRSRYGLNAGVFSNDLGEVLYAVEHLEVGTVVVNQSSSFRADHMPYGGVKESGLGREGIRYAMAEMTETKFAAIKLPDPA